MNTLESLLQQAAANPAARPAFYEALLAATVHVISSEDASSPAGQIDIVHWEKEDGSQVIPFFSSLELLQKNSKPGEGHRALSGRALFELVAQGDLPLVLNPNADYGKEFWLAEIQALLNSGSNRPTTASVVQKEAHVLIGMPVREPEAIVAALTGFFRNQPAVSAAYAGSIHDRDQDAKPNLILGISAELEGPALERVINQAGQIASELLHDDEVLDIVRVKAGEHGLSEYFLARIKPFYTR